MSCRWHVGVSRFGGCRKRTSDAWVAGREYAAEARSGPALLVQAVCQFEWAGRRDYRAWLAREELAFPGIPALLRRLEPRKADPEGGGLAVVGLLRGCTVAHTYAFRGVLRCVDAEFKIEHYGQVHVLCIKCQVTISDAAFLA